MSDWKNVQYKDGKMRTSEGGGGGGSSTFAGLDDVSFNNLQNGQVPKYNSTKHKWENADESGGGGTVTDVEVDGVSVVNPQTGVAEIEMPTPPTIPIEDVEVNGESVVNAQKVAEIKSYKEVTQSEYNALPASKTSDGILYCIKDSAGADGFPPLIYSDEEREIGVWRDGKPLYQKNFWLSSRTYIKNDYTTILDSDVTAYNIENIVSGCIYDNNGGADLKRVRLLTGDISLIVSNNNQLIAWASANNAYATIGYLLQYTKTTDTAGSGTWTTQGGYTHHYSTSEKVIGTWIDGKPLYEKTLQKTFSTRDREGNTSYYHGNVDISSDIQNLKHGFVVVDASYYGTYPNERGFTFGYVEPDWSSSGAGLVLGTLFERVNFTGYITVRYTKTTD